MNKINEKINLLNWYNDEDIQNNMIIELSNNLKVEDIKYLLEPIDKNFYHNTAKVIKNIINRDKIKLLQPNIVRKLLRRIMDLNWPGVQTTIEVLLNLDNDLINECILLEIKSALYKNDIEYINSLCLLLSKIKVDYDFSSMIKYVINNDFEYFKRWLFE